MASWTDPATVAASLSAVAAIAAAVATWRGPISAARMAETLRRNAEAAADGRRFKLNIFAQLMQERSEIYSAEAVRALNSIDVAFSDTISVREAWSELYQSLNSQPIAPDHVVDERIRKLLREMANSLGIGDRLRMDDFGRVYLPNALLEERRVRDLERRSALTRLSSQAAPAGNAAEHTTNLFPPKPE
jgi:hypothetical protein